jgi:hemerythrin
MDIGTRVQSLFKGFGNSKINSPAVGLKPDLHIQKWLRGDFYVPNRGRYFMTASRSRGRKRMETRKVKYPLGRLSGNVQRCVYPQTKKIVSRTGIINPVTTVLCYPTMEGAMSITEMNGRYSITDWHDRYAIGIPVIDSRYQHLFCLFNTDNDGFIEYASTSDLLIVFDQLVDYAQYHFFAEERWMRYHKFPRLANHEMDHEGILTKISDIYAEFRDGIWPLSLEILEVMHMWIRHHVLTSDQEISDFIVAQQLGNSPHSREYRRKTVDTARVALHAWHNYYNQTEIGIDPSLECVEKNTWNNGGMSC